jgi:hypothetical protein
MQTIMYLDCQEEFGVNKSDLGNDEDTDGVAVYIRLFHQLVGRARPHNFGMMHPRVRRLTWYLFSLLSFLGVSGSSA